MARHFRTPENDPEPLRSEPQGFTPTASPTRSARVQRMPVAQTDNVYASAVGEAAPRRRRRRRWPVVLLLLVLLGAGGFGGWWFWNNKRPVDVTVNGAEVQVPINSTLREVYEQGEPVAPGNFVSVGGNILEEGAGEELAATLNGEAVPAEELANRTVTGGEEITFEQGADTMEEYTTEIEVTQPKLEFRVKEGTGDKGYMVQQGMVQYVYQWGYEGKVEIRHGSVSGETARGETLQELQNCVIMIQDIHPDNDEPLVALTFDDGPTYYTEPYMQILANYGINATFNMIGEQVPDYASVVRANAEAGNQLASHTWDHQQLTTLEPQTLREELQMTTDAIYEASGVTVTQIRPPYGDLDNDCWVNCNGLMTVSVYWSHDSEDWQQPGVDTMVSYCTSWMAPGSVILMHDGGGAREQDLEALPRIIEAWQNAGYRFVTMEELLASDSSIPREIIDGQQTMPEGAVWPTELA